MKTLELRLDDDLMDALQAVSSEHHMDAITTASEAIRRYVATERARSALGSTDLVSLYGEFSGDDLDAYDEQALELDRPRL